MRASIVAVLVALSLAACGSDTAPPKYGPAAMAIISGNHQTAQAGAVHLTDPAVAQLYRQPDGTVALRPVRHPRLNTLLATVLPAPLYAQTVVKGAPIAGAVVCWADVPGRPRLRPFSVCVNTANDGTASFNLSPDTVAGTAAGEVHWDSAGRAIVTDSVDATITPGLPVRLQWNCGQSCGAGAAPGDTVSLLSFIGGFIGAESIGGYDRFGNALSLVQLAALPDSVVGWAWYGSGADPTAPAGHGWKTVVPASFPADYGVMVWVGQTYEGGIAVKGR